MGFEKSCGAIVFTRRGNEPLYVIVQEQAGAYSFPKGHMEGDETEEQTALREVFEETGLHIELMPGFRETDEYDLAEKPGVKKQVVYFLAEYAGEQLVPRPGEIKRIFLCAYRDALKYFPQEGARRVLAAADRYLTRV